MIPITAVRLRVNNEKPEWEQKQYQSGFFRGNDNSKIVCVTDNKKS